MSEDIPKGLPVNIYIQNPDTGEWEKGNLNKLLADILAKLEEIRVILAGGV